MTRIPQFFNVFKGEMSLVGPRPEVREFVSLYSNEQKRILNIKPGITDVASIEFINENELLANKANPDEYYAKVIMPQKISLNLVFVNNPTLKNYFKILFSTCFKILTK